MRESCIGCVNKHVASALILLQEYQSDPVLYVRFANRAIGHLTQAEEESSEWGELAKMIRILRKLLWDNFEPTKRFNEEKLLGLRFETILEMINNLYLETKGVKDE